MCKKLNKNIYNSLRISPVWGPANPGTLKRVVVVKSSGHLRVKCPVQTYYFLSNMCVMSNKYVRQLQIQKSPPDHHLECFLYSSDLTKPNSTVSTLCIARIPLNEIKVYKTHCCGVVSRANSFN